MKDEINNIIDHLEETLKGFKQAYKDEGYDLANETHHVTEALKLVKNLTIPVAVNPVICPNCEEECEPIPLGQMCNKCYYDKM